MLKWQRLYFTVIIFANHVNIIYLFFILLLLLRINNTLRILKLLLHLQLFVLFIKLMLSK